MIRNYLLLLACITYTYQCTIFFCYEFDIKKYDFGVLGFFVFLSFYFGFLSLLPKEDAKQIMITYQTTKRKLKEWESEKAIKSIGWLCWNKVMHFWTFSPFHLKFYLTYYNDTWIFLHLYGFYWSIRNNQIWYTLLSFPKLCIT